MTLEEALDRLDRAECYIASLRDQIDRERADMRERYGWEVAHLRQENERLLRLLVAPSLMLPHPATGFVKIDT